MKNEKAIKLKVCGMRSSGNILEVGSLSPDYMGFIFFQGSKRYVGDNFVIPPGFPPEIKRVGVFVNESTLETIRLADKHHLHFIQLHGDEPATQCEELKGKGFKVIKAFSVDHTFDFSTIQNFKKVVDFFLFDTKGINYGGNGLAFDWDILKMYDQEIPFFLSGGISEENIGNLSYLKGMNIHAIDINSRVEKAVGIKDAGLIEKIKSQVDHIRISKSTN